MAELNTSTRNRKQIPKVDLTAMVDLAFLLITFLPITGHQSPDHDNLFQILLSFFFRLPASDF